MVSAILVFGEYGSHEIMAYKNIPFLKNMLQNNMLRRLKKDVLDLPPKIYYTEYVENTPIQRKLYYDIQQDMLEHEDEILESMNPLTSMLRLRQVNGSPELVDENISIDDDYIHKNAKLARLLEIVYEIVESGEKVVIFSNWVGALSVNHTLTVANNVIFLDEPWTLSDKVQAEDRCHRISATIPVNIYTLLSKGTIDETVHKIVYDKQDILTFIVDGKLDLRKNPDLFEKLLGKSVK